MKSLATCFIAIICALTLTACGQEKPYVSIGIVVPLEHKAMDEIVAGFSETLREMYHHPVEIKVANAQNDANLQRAIIQQMRDENMNVIVPIGTDTTRMTLAIAHSQSILSLASDISEKDRQKLKLCNIAIVHDEISPAQLIKFIHAVYPSLTRLVLIHSAANKIIPQAAETIAAGKKNGIEIKDVMINSLPKLAAAAGNIPANTQGIFILKDNLIVSGISTLAKVSKKRHIPLITSDEGSVQKGADFALGVPETEIGIEGGKMAAAILNNTPACHLPIAEVKNLTVFINQKAMRHTAQNTNTVSNAAKKFHYSVEFV